MNIFYIDECPVKAAQMQCNKHAAGKMVLESAQMLCTAHHEYGNHDVPYKVAHRNHPSTVWAGESHTNFVWLLTHAFACIHEAACRYNKDAWEYKVTAILDKVEIWADRTNCHHNFPESGWTKPKLAMPDEFKGDDTVDSYRRYFRSKPNVVYKRTHAPAWYYDANALPRI